MRLARASEIALLVLLLLWGSAPRAVAQVSRPEQRLLVGRVSSGGRPIERAIVERAGSGARVLTGVDGRFTLSGSASGTTTIRVRAIGYIPLVHTVAAENAAELLLVLMPGVSVLNTVVTTGTLSERYVSESPVKVDVVTPAFLQRNVTNNLMDNISFLPGLSQQVDCGVCFSNNIRINGMEGPYTAVLIDGTPLVSALATVYGLNSIDPSLIEQIEIIKGPSSTLYGSEAMGGVINIVTKDPRLAPRFSVNAFGTSNGETSIAIGAAPQIFGVRTLLSVNGSYNSQFVDRNGDGFSDLPLVRRVSVLNKWVTGTSANRPLEVSGRFYAEDRFGGVRAWTRSDRGSSSVYGESIRTNRAELLGTYRLNPALAPVRFDVSANWHQQDSFYGNSAYMATQTVAFGQALWSPQFGAHALVIGATLRHQFYRDSTAAQQTRDARFIPGVFAQDEVPLGARTTLLGGLRLDHHRLHGVIPSPRLALKWVPDQHTTVRLNAATGFRVVSLFTEDHAALTGARTVRIAERLNPERSATITAGINRVVDVRGIEDALTLDVDAFYTRFTNRIVGDFDSDPQAIVYANLDGIAVTRGVSFASGFATLRQPLFANLGVTLQDVFIREQGVRRDLPFAPAVQGVFTLGYRFSRLGLTVDWTGRVQGPTPLPRYEGLPSRSSWFTEQHVQMGRRMPRGPEIYLAVKNLFNYVQRDPIIDPQNPFGDNFATERVYGPLQGRRLLLGIRQIVAR